MRIAIDRDSQTPLYQQIVQHLRHSIITGALAPQTRLPASRQLARDLGVNRITVDTAYAELITEGLLISRVGSGTYVLPQEEPLIPTPNTSGPTYPLWQFDTKSGFPLTHRPSPEALLAQAQHPDPINFSAGIGDSNLFPVEDIRKVIQQVMRSDGVNALEYGDRSGYAPLRGTISHVLASQGLNIMPDNILITAGSQQAISLVCQVLLHQGDVILVENPTYSGALELFNALGYKVIGVPVDGYGMRVDLLEALLQQHHPKLIYTIPNFHNPTGTCLTSPRRQTLIDLAGRYNIPILEDDFVGDLRYEGRAQPALKSLDPDGRVIFVSTFSKMLIPGLRVGFLAAHGPVYDCLVQYKRVNDLATSNLIQRSLEAYMTVGRYQAHLHRSCQVYRKRRDVMLQAIHRHMPANARVLSPQGGLFVWLELPDGPSTQELLPLACKQGVSFAPGGSFFLNEEDGAHFMRLNFVTQPPARIDEGMSRLAGVIQSL